MLRLFDHLSHKKHVIFDYNGTILYDTHLCVEALNLLLDSHQMPLVNEAYYREHFHFPISSFYQKVGFDFERESFETLGTRYMAYYFEQFDRCRVYEGIRPLLKNLRDASITTSILTALNHQSLLQQLQALQLIDFFDATFGLPDHRAHSKIERGHDLMKHVGVDPKETIIVGDTDHDFEVAKALGIEVILLADGPQSEDHLKKTGAKVLQLERSTESVYPPNNNPLNIPS